MRQCLLFLLNSLGGGDMQARVRLPGLFWTFFTLFSQSSLCAFLCLAFFNSGDLDACYVSNFGGVLGVNLRSSPFFVNCLLRCVWDLFRFNIDVCCIRGKCD